MCSAFLSMAWNTGSSSPGELEMTRNTSAVAVCRSNASPRALVRCRNSLSSRVFSMAMDGLFREIAYQLNLLVGEGPHLLAVNADHADELVLLQHRNGHKGPRTAVFCDRRVGAFHRHVCDLDRAHNVDCVRKARGRQARRFFAEFRKL